MVCWSGRELRNTTRNALIMFVLNTSFADPSRKSVTQSGATCFETIDDLGGADGLAGNSLEARSQDSVTTYRLPKEEIVWNADSAGESTDSRCGDGGLACYETQPWDERLYKQFRIETGNYRDLEVPAFEEPYCPCGNDLSPECNPSRENPFNPSPAFALQTDLANVV